jgi:TonB family protein
MRLTRIPYASALLWASLLAPAAPAAEEPDNVPANVSESARQSTPAVQIRRDAPEYPRSELRKNREAWVHITYCIDETGAIQNVSVLDSIGNNAFDQAAIETVKNWEFEPAIQNGEPAWQSRNEVYINFAIETDDLSRKARPKFVRQFRKLGDYIDDGKLAEADKFFWQIYEAGDLSLYELGKLWAQRVRYEAKTGDYYRLNMALKRATASHGSWIEKDSYVRLLKARVQVEVRLGKYNQAMHSYGDLVEATGDDNEDVAAVRPIIERLREMIAGDQVLQIQAEVRSRGECIYCNNSWDFTPVRADFTITNIQGSLTSLDMRCDNKRFEAAVADLVEWHIPENWGKCHIQIYGEPGTTFDVFMLPAVSS